MADAVDVVKRGRGRPTKYKSEYCQAVEDMGREGYSVVEMAATLGVARSTVEEDWPVAHEDFAEAFARARELSQAWWERQGRLGLTAEKFNAQLYSRSMSARFPRDWREQKTLSVGGDPDAPAIQHEHKPVRPDQIADLAQLALSKPSGS